ncbi:hypothetical protein RRG08_054705 [Elysia crispata]|uniref:Uncharacterized protein n=1 Tax=Elysia crispata TaxID=231223 RepID=A0AAE1E8B9_9GAST|nr:hypothetical protein RRG08_054705 [Elysia crispata]
MDSDGMNHSLSGATHVFNPGGITFPVKALQEKRECSRESDQVDKIVVIAALVGFGVAVMKRAIVESSISYNRRDRPIRRLISFYADRVGSDKRQRPLGMGTSPGPFGGALVRA